MKLQVIEWDRFGQGQEYATSRASGSFKQLPSRQRLLDSVEVKGVRGADMNLLKEVGWEIRGRRGQWTECMLTVEMGSGNAGWSQRSRPDCMRDKFDAQRTVKLQSGDTGVGRSSRSASTWIGKGGGSGAPFLLEAATLRLCVVVRGKWGPAPYSGNRQKMFPPPSRYLLFCRGTAASFY